MPNPPDHLHGSGHQCSGFGGEHLGIVGATFCTRSHESGMRVSKRPERDCVAWAPAIRKGIPPARRNLATLADQESRNQREPKEHSNKCRAEKQGFPIVVFACTHVSHSSFLITAVR